MWVGRTSIFIISIFLFSWSKIYDKVKENFKTCKILRFKANYLWIIKSATIFNTAIRKYHMNIAVINNSQADSELNSLVFLWFELHSFEFFVMNFKS